MVRFTGSKAIYGQAVLEVFWKQNLDFSAAPEKASTFTLGKRVVPAQQDYRGKRVLMEREIEAYSSAVAWVGCFWCCHAKSRLCFHTGDGGTGFVISVLGVF